MRLPGWPRFLARLRPPPAEGGREPRHPSPDGPQHGLHDPVDGNHPRRAFDGALRGGQAGLALLAASAPPPAACRRTRPYAARMTAACLDDPFAQADTIC